MSSTTSKFVWVDIPVTNLDRAVAFYSTVCDCEVEKMQGEGFAMGIFPHEGAETGGCLYVPSDDVRPSMNGPLVYLNVNNRLDAAIGAVESCGGRIVQAKHAIGPYGFRAIVADSEGNRIALHSQAG